MFIHSFRIHFPIFPGPPYLTHNQLVMKNGFHTIRTLRVHSEYQCLRGFQPFKSLHFEAF